jgi:crotonobetainyl-CoA:carnitine CoA-transferase CaiB-like acyl-CoA transferase
VGPLSGFRVLDFGIAGTGPWTGSLLGQLGADVIKVEPPAGDITRFHNPRQRGIGAAWIAMNANKRSIQLDLRSADGLAAARALAGRTDILSNNFRPGTMERLGLGYATLAQANPGLVYCQITGFGDEGPLADRTCADFIMQAFSGFAAANGAEAERLEMYRFSGLLDLCTSVTAVQGTLAAMLERASSGRGQFVGVSMLESALALLMPFAARYWATGDLARPGGSRSALAAPDAAFETLDDPVFVSVVNDSQWRDFCPAIERADLAADQRFASAAARLAHREALYAELARTFQARRSRWWLVALRRANVPCAIGLDFERFRYHEQFTAQGLLAELDTETWGPILIPGCPWIFERMPCVLEPAPVPNSDTERVLAELGLLADAAAPAEREG